MRWKVKIVLEEDIKNTEIRSLRRFASILIQQRPGSRETFEKLVFVNFIEKNCNIFQSHDFYKENLFWDF